MARLITVCCLLLAVCVFVDSCGIEIEDDSECQGNRGRGKGKGRCKSKKSKKGSGSGSGSGSHEGSSSEKGCKVPATVAEVLGMENPWVTPGWESDEVTATFSCVGDTESYTVTGNIACNDEAKWEVYQEGTLIPEDDYETKIAEIMGDVEEGVAACVISGGTGQMEVDMEIPQEIIDEADSFSYLTVTSSTVSIDFSSMTSTDVSDLKAILKKLMKMYLPEYAEETNSQSGSGSGSSESSESSTAASAGSSTAASGDGSTAASGGSGTTAASSGGSGSFSDSFSSSALETQITSELSSSNQQAYTWWTTTATTTQKTTIITTAYNAGEAVYVGGGTLAQAIAAAKASVVSQITALVLAGGR